MTDINEIIAKELGKHFVSLSCLHNRKATDSQDTHVFSGFMTSIQGEWFYITAGHIIEFIRQSIEKGDTFECWRLSDATAGGKFAEMAVPFDFNIDEWAVLYVENEGIDYAVTPITGLYKKQLEAGGVTPLAENSWGSHADDHEQWALFGIPSETVEHDGETVITAKYVMVALHRTAAPTLAEDKANNQFFAKLTNNSEHAVKDVDGMSGGPIFGLTRIPSGWRYGVIGVQSGWYGSDRVVAACPISSFIQELEKVVQEVRQKSQSAAQEDI